MIAADATPARAQDAQELTAEASVRLALERNETLRAAGAETAEARALLREVRAERLPSITARGDYTRLSDIPPVDFSLPGLDSSFTVLPVERDRYQLELSVEQPLFTGFRLGNEAEAAERQAEAAELLEEQERAVVAFEVRRAYWTLYHAMAVREAVAGSLEQIDEHLDNIRQRVEEGAALRADLLRARTRRAEVVLERVEAANAVRVARLELNRLIGQPLTTEVRPVDDPPLEVPDQGLDVLIAEGLDESPRLDALRQQAAALDARVRAAGGDRFPSVGLFGRYLYARPNPYFLAEPNEFHGTWEVGLSTQWGIWEGGRRSARTAGARARLEAADARLADAQEQATVEITRQYLEIQRAGEALEAATLMVAEAEETLAVVRLQYDEGVAISEQVLDAEQAYRAARARYALAQAEHAIARAALLTAVGRVW